MIISSALKDDNSVMIDFYQLYHELLWDQFWTSQGLTQGCNVSINPVRIIGSKANKNENRKLRLL